MSTCRIDCEWWHCLPTSLMDWWYRLQVVGKQHDYSRQCMQNSIVSAKGEGEWQLRKGHASRLYRCLQV